MPLTTVVFQCITLLMHPMLQLVMYMLHEVVQTMLKFQAFIKIEVILLPGSFVHRSTGRAQ